jgi:hypothetical protein
MKNPDYGKQWRTARAIMQRLGTFTVNDLAGLTKSQAQSVISNFVRRGEVVCVRQPEKHRYGRPGAYALTPAASVERGSSQRSGSSGKACESAKTEYDAQPQARILRRIPAALSSGHLSRRECSRAV